MLGAKGDCKARISHIFKHKRRKECTLRRFFLSIGVFFTTLIICASILLFTTMGNKILLPIAQAGLNTKLPFRTKIESLHISFGNISAYLTLADTLKAHLRGKYTFKGFDLLVDFTPLDEISRTIQSSANPINSKNPPKSADISNNTINQNLHFTLRLVGKYKDYIIASIKDTKLESSTQSNLDSSQIFNASFLPKKQNLPAKNATSNAKHINQNITQDRRDFGSFNDIMDFYNSSQGTLPRLPNELESSTQNMNLTSLDSATFDSALLDSALDFALDFLQNPAKQTPEIKLLARAKYFSITSYAIELKAFPAIIASRILDFPFYAYGIFDLQAKVQKNHIQGILNAKNLTLSKKNNNGRNGYANLLSLQAKFTTQDGNLLSATSLALKSPLQSQLKSRANTLQHLPQNLQNNPQNLLQNPNQRKKIPRPSIPKNILPNLALLINASTNLKTLETQAKITDSYQIPLGTLHFSAQKNGQYDLEIFNLAPIGAMFELALRGDMHLSGTFDIDNGIIEGKSSTLGGFSSFTLKGENLTISGENIALEKLLTIFSAPIVLEGRAQLSTNYNFIFSKGNMKLQANNISTNIAREDLSFYGISGLQEKKELNNAGQQELDFLMQESLQNKPLQNPTNATTNTTLILDSKLNAGIQECNLNITTPSEKLESTRCTINLVSQILQITLKLKPTKNAQSSEISTPIISNTPTLSTPALPDINTDNHITKIPQNLTPPNTQNMQNPNIQNPNIMEGLEINISGYFSSPQVQKKFPELPLDDDEFLEF